MTSSSDYDIFMKILLIGSLNKRENLLSWYVEGESIGTRRLGLDFMMKRVTVDDITLKLQLWSLYLLLKSS